MCADLFGGGVEEHVAVLGGAARAPGLEEVLHADADLAFDAADGLLEHAGKDGIGLFDGDGELELFVGVVHGGADLN